MNIESSVFENLGRAIYAAQCLEETLVRENLALDSNADVLNPDSILQVEEKLRKMTLGGLLKDWKPKVDENDWLLDHLKTIKDERNLLAHGIFRTSEFPTSKEMNDKIILITKRLKVAQYLVIAHNPMMRRQLDQEWGITDEDRMG